MTNNKSAVTTKVATLALPTREAQVVASIWPGQWGMLLFLAELNLAPQTRQEFLQNITADIERGWQEVKTTPGPADDTLEAIVLSTNRLLANSERLRGNPLSPRYQLLLAYLSDQQVALTSLGHLDAFVISATKLANIMVATGRRTAKLAATFNNLISGELAPGESLLLATPALTDYFSFDRLRQLISNRPPGLSLREIERYILQLKVRPPLGLICLQLSLTQQVEGTGESMDHLLQTKAQTASLLQPKFFSYLKSKLARHQPTTTAYTDITRPPPPPLSAETITKVKTAGGLTLRLARIMRALRKLSWLTSRESVKATVSWWLESKLTLWRRLPHAKRALLLLGLAVLLAASQSIVNLGRGKLKTTDSEYYNQIVTKITERQAEIEAALIYGNDDKARALYDEVTTLLATLPRNSRSRTGQGQALEQSLSLLQRRLQRLNEVAEPTAWSQLPPLPEGTNWRNLAVISGKVMVISSAGRVTQLAADGKVGQTRAAPADSNDIRHVITLENELLLVSQNGQLAIYDTATARTNQLNQKLTLADGSFYSHGLYFLNDNIIWRATRQGNGFAAPTRWLKTSQGELTNARGLTVDGSIFVALPTEVQKFARGLRQDFKLAAVNPPLSSLTSISTASDVDYLYLWETASSRLITFDKQGKLVIQLTFPSLPEVTAMAVDGQSKLLYLLSSNTVYRVPILSPTVSP